MMKVTRIDPKTGLKKKFNELEERIRNQEGKPTGTIVVRDDQKIVAYDPTTQVETILGKLPDGSTGFQPFVGDTEPPPVATAPIATEQPGTMTVYWDGAFVGGAEQPKDFQHVNVNAHKVVSGSVVQTTFVGVIRLPNESVLVSTDVASVGSTWKFSFTSEDYNKNLSASSAFSPVVTMLSTAADEEITQIIEDIEDALANTNKVWYETTAPSGTAHKKGDTWYDTDDGNKIYVWNGSQWVNSQDAAIRAAQVAATGAQATADGKNKNYYQPAKPTGGSYKNGDQWFDTDDGYKLHVYTGSDFVPFQDAAILAAQVAATGAQTTANGKNTNYYSPTKPTGGTYKAGDQWFDTDDGYKLYVYVTTPAVNGVSNDFAPFQDAAIGYLQNNVASVSATAGGALSVANGKNKNYVGTTAPSPSANNVVGDLWIDSANGNKINRWNGTAWIDYRDTGIAAASQAATAAMAVANGKSTSFLGGTSPTASAVGDLWLDTANGNQLKRWNGSTWVDARDSFIGVAQQAATAAQATANGKNTSYYTPTEPTGGTYKVGDLWFDTDDNYKLYTYKGGTPAWQLVQDAAGAKTIADSKNRTFIQGTAPSALAVGDLWIDTANNNQLKRASAIGTGNWVDARDTTIAAASLAASAAQLSANGKNKVIYSANPATGTTGYSAGDTWFQRDTGTGQIIAQWEFTTSWQSRELAHNVIASIDAGKIVVGTLGADRIGANTISADKLLVGFGMNMAYNGSAQSDAPGSNNGWSGFIRATSNPPTAGYTSYWQSTAGQSTTNFLNNPALPVKPNTTYRVNVWVKADKPGSVVYLEPMTGSTAAGHRTTPTYAFSSLPVPTEWTRWTQDITTGTAPAGTLYFRWFLNHVNGTVQDSVFSFTGFELIEMTTGELIVNGAIKAGSAIIEDGAIGTAQIGNAQITEAKIKDLAVTSAKISEVDAGLIKSGYIISDRIEARSVAMHKLMVTDLANFAPSLEESPDDWYIDSPISVITTGTVAYDRKRLQFIDSSGVAKLARGPLIAVKEGDELYGEGVIYRTGATTNNISIRYYFYDYNENYLSSNSTKLDGSATPTNEVNATLHKIKAVAPASAMYARFVVLMTNATGADIGMYNLRGYRRNGGELLVDGTIVAGSAIIATGAIESAQISSLNAGKVSASWLQAGELKAGAIKTANLAVSDQTNFAPSYAEDETAWTFSGGATNIATSIAAAYDQRRFRLNANSAGASAQGPLFAAAAGDDLYAEGQVYRTGATTNNIYLRYQFYNSSKTLIGDAGKMYDGATKGDESTTVGNLANSAMHKITAVAPASTMYARLCVVFTNTTAADIGMYNVRGYRRFGGTLIVDGAIVANSAIIANGAIDGAQIKNATIQAANIASVSANSITVGTMDGDRIAAGTLVADRLVIGIGNNLVSDPNFTNADIQATRKTLSDSATAGTWTVDPANQWVTLTAGATPAQLQWRLRDSLTPATNRMIPISSGRKYAIQFEVFRPTGTTPLIRSNIYYRNAAGTGFYVTDGITNVTPPDSNAWNLVTRVWTPPADAVSFAVDLVVTTTSGLTGLRFRSPSVRAMSDATVIEDGAIKTQHITTGTLDAGVLVAGSVKAQQLSAKSVGIDKLLVSSTDNVVQDGDFTGGGAGWYLATDATPAAGWSIGATAGRGSTPALQCVSNGTQQESWSSSVTAISSGGVQTKTRVEYPASPSAAYRVSAWVKSTTTVPVSGARILIRYKYESITATFDAGVYTVNGVPATIPANQWVEISKMFVAPATTIAVSFGVQSAANATGTLYCDSFKATRASNGELVVDGSIKANHLDVGSVNAGKIAAGAVGALEIGAKQISADKLLISSTDNLVQEGDFAGGGLSWELPTGVTIATSGGRVAGSSVMSISGASRTSFNAVGNPTKVPIEVPMTKGQAVRVSMWIKGSGTVPVSGALINARFKLTTGGPTTISMPYNVVTNGVAVPSTLAAGQWGEVFGTIKAPDEAVSVAFSVSTSSGFSGTLTVDSVKVTRASNGELIVDGSITGDQIKAQSVDASVLKANTITGDLIVGKTISVDKLLIASTDNIVSEGDFSAGGVAWGAMGTPYFIDPTGARDGTAAFKIVNSAAQHGRYNLNYIPVEAPETSAAQGASYRMSVWAKADVAVPNGAVSVYVRRKKADGTTSPVLLASNVGAQSANTWFKISGIYTVPWDAVSPTVAITFGLYKQNTLTSGNTWFDSLIVTRAGDSNLVLDGAMDAKSITGGTIQTSASANRGIKLTPSAFTGYDGSGNVMFNLSNTGSLTLKGSIESGSTIDGTAITGSTITGGTVQSSASANRGIKLTSAELVGYDNAGVKNFILSSAGDLTLRDSLLTGGSITGSTITGGLFRTATSGARVEIDSPNGLRVLDASANVLLQASGSGVSLVGELLARGKIATYPTTTMLSTFLGPVRYNTDNDDTTPALYFLKDGDTISSTANPTGFFPPSIKSNGTWLSIEGSTQIGHRSYLNVGGPNHNGQALLVGSLSAGVQSASGGLVYLGDNNQNVSITGTKVEITTGTDGLVINGKKHGWEGITKSNLPLTGIYTSYTGFDSAKYYLGPERVELSGLVGCSTANISLVGGTYYPFANIGSAAAPAVTEVFPIAVGPSMSPSILLFVRSTGILEYYSPTAQTLTQANFYLGLSGVSWLRDS